MFVDLRVKGEASLLYFTASGKRRFIVMRSRMIEDELLPDSSYLAFQCRREVHVVVILLIVAVVVVIPIFVVILIIQVLAFIAAPVVFAVVAGLVVFAIANIIVFVVFIITFVTVVVVVFPISIITARRVEGRRRTLWESKVVLYSLAQTERLLLDSSRSLTCQVGFSVVLSHCCYTSCCISVAS